MALGIRFISGKYEGASFVLATPLSMVMGRGQDADIILAEDMVSRRHTRLDIGADDRVLVTDLGSTNGTYINGEKVAQRSAILGDRVLVGTSIIKLVAPAELGLAPEQDLGRVREAMRQAAAQVTQRSTMSGDLGDVPLPDLVTLFASNEKSGVLTISGARRGKVYLQSGQVVYAMVGGDIAVSPMKAFCRMVGWREGKFQLDDQAPTGSFPEEIQLPTSNLLMEAVRQLDEFDNFQHQLPPPDADLTLAVPMVPKLSELEPPELDVMQLVLNFNRLEAIVDKSPQTDLTVAKTVQKLLAGGYLEVD